MGFIGPFFSEGSRLHRIQKGTGDGWGLVDVWRNEKEGVTKKRARLLDVARLNLL